MVKSSRLYLKADNRGKSISRNSKIRHKSKSRKKVSERKRKIGVEESSKGTFLEQEILKEKDDYNNKIQDLHTNIFQNNFSVFSQVVPSMPMSRSGIINDSNVRSKFEKDVQDVFGKIIKQKQNEAILRPINTTKFTMGFSRSEIIKDSNYTPKFCKDANIQLFTILSMGVSRSGIINDSNVQSLFGKDANFQGGSLFMCTSRSGIIKNSNYTPKFGEGANIQKLAMGVSRSGIINDSNVQSLFGKDANFEGGIFMGVSRSGIINDSNVPSLFVKPVQDVFGKIISQKQNGAILPQLIYSTQSQINFSREELKRILKLENQIRLSEESRRLFDKNRYGSPEVYLDLDNKMIKKALYESGYFPDKDDSLKAYHLATTKYINEPDVREEVVWMKYDKCKVGNFRVGDRAIIDKINLFKLNGDGVEFRSILSPTKPNLIVSGSAS